MALKSCSGVSCRCGEKVVAVAPGIVYGDATCARVVVHYGYHVPAVDIVVAEWWHVSVHNDRDGEASISTSTA